MGLTYVAYFSAPADENYLMMGTIVISLDAYAMTKKLIKYFNFSDHLHIYF